MKIALLPLDERPVNTRYPQMIATIAGIDLILPPMSLLSHLRQSSKRPQLLHWLEEQAQNCDALIISCEQFALGGLITSRISDESSSVITHWLTQLSEIKLAYPQLKILAFSVITRISNANNNIEEPLYWDTQGVNLYRYSQLVHRQQMGQAVDTELATLQDNIPAEVIQDFTGRRLRNHQVNLHLLELFAQDIFDLLVISSDDTSEYGYGTQEKAWLKTWVHRLYAQDERLLMYPGADEIGCVLLMRAILAERTPSFYCHYAIEADKTRIAPYEDGAISLTVERQIKAIGGVITDDSSQADFIVAINPPSRIGQEYDPEAEHFASEYARRQPHIEHFVHQIQQWIADEKSVILCDVAYPNGSDPMLIDQLLANVTIGQLSAYGAWNTAGNTIGVALAQGVAQSFASTPEQHTAQTQFLLHRFIEDWGYQHLVREAIRDELQAETGLRDTSATNEAQTITRIHDKLTQLLPSLQPLSDGWQLDTVSLPWHRTFEVDFDLVQSS